MHNKNKIVRISMLAVVALLAVGAGCTQTATKTPKTPITNTAPTNANVAVAAFDATASESAVLADKNGKWAKTVIASSEYGNDAWSAKQAAGKPNVSVYGDDGYAWAPESKDKGEETLELSFAKVVTPLGVRVRETYGSGALTKIELKDTAGVYQTVWEGVDTTTGLAYVQVAVEDADYQTDTVKLTFNTTLSPEEWVEVDAVQLVGK